MNLADNRQNLTTRVANISDAPVWMRHDVYITRGYRRSQNSFRGCFDSLWYIHNETVNVWSHLLTGALFLTLFIWSNIPALHGGYAISFTDLWALQTYLLGATLCLVFSVSYCARLQLKLVELSNKFKYLRLSTIALAAIRKTSPGGALSLTTLGLCSILPQHRYLQPTLGSIMNHSLHAFI